MFDLGRQRRQRLEYWMEALKGQLLQTVATVPMEGFETLEARLSPEEAARRPMRPYRPGEKWGGCWAYGWFHAEVTLPACCEGQRVVFCSGIGGEQLVYVNGQAAGSIDLQHHSVTLHRQARSGETFSLLIESYAGHGARLEHLGPCPQEQSALPPVPACQCEVTESTICVVNESAYQLLLDVQTLWELLEVLPDKSLRAQKVAKALMDFTYICDVELPAGEKRNASFQAARAALAPALACRNGSTAPELYLLGQSHIDLAWLWPVEETYHKSVRTFSNQLALMEEYPEYRFLLCEPALLEMLKKRDHVVWERVKDAVRRGQMVPEGAFYVEADTTIVSGESLIRQLMWGKRWFREELGVDSQVAWQPDTFGYSGQLPQIFAGLGVRYFATQKLLRADPECERFPYQHFIWEGIDGSEVFALSFFDNNGLMGPGAFAKRWEHDRVQMEDIDKLLYPFGYGDGGGGPTREMLESARRLADLEGVPRSYYSGLREYFEDVERQGTKNRWVGELYLSWHRGTLTSQVETKRGIKAAERAIHDAEALLALLPSKQQRAYAMPLRALWDQLMLCQFHDIAPGTSIRRVHQEAVDTLREVTRGAREMEADLRRKLTGLDEQAEGLVFLNPLPWPVHLDMLEEQARYILPPNSIINAQGCERIPLPAGCHWEENAEAYLVENRYLRLTLDRCSGCITSLEDKDAGLPLMSPGQTMNDWRLYKNVECVYDAWEMSRDWTNGLIPDALEAQVTLEVSTPEKTVLRVERWDRQNGPSAFHAVQHITLYADSRQIDFHVKIDWAERHRLLKVHFESNLIAEDALHEIQFGYVHRPAHSSHPYAADRYEVNNQRYSALCEGNRGFALLNDGIFGLSSGRGELALSLLRAPLVPDDTNNLGHHELHFSLYPFATDFAHSGVVKAAYELNAAPQAISGQVKRACHGPWCDSDSVILETIKPAEDGNGLILRLYESLGGVGYGTVRLPFNANVYDCGMSETHCNLIGCGNALPITLRAFEIKTLRVVRKA